MLDGPVHYWPILESLANVVPGRTGLTEVTATTRDEPAPWGPSRRASGTVVSYRPITQFDVNILAWTMEVWQKARVDPTTLVDTALIGSWGPSSGSMMYLGTGGTIRQYARDTNSDSGVTTDQRWSHYAMTFDTVTDKRYVYKNGVVILDVTDTVNGVLSKSAWGIGEYNLNGTTAKNQSFAHAAWYASALSATRIKAHYEAGIRSGVVL